MQTGWFEPAEHPWAADHHPWDWSPNLGLQSCHHLNLVGPIYQRDSKTNIAANAPGHWNVSPE